MGLGGPQNAQAIENASAAQQALAGSNRDVVANIRAIRMANLSAAEVLKAELAGQKPNTSLPPKPTGTPEFSSPVLPAKPSVTTNVPSATLDASPMSAGGRSIATPMQTDDPIDADVTMASSDDVSSIVEEGSFSSVGTKRKLDDEADDEGDEALPDDEEGDGDGAVPVSALDLKVNADGTVDQEDTVKYVLEPKYSYEDLWESAYRLWEPGYKDRYYRQKFGAEPNDLELRKT